MFILADWGIANGTFFNLVSGIYGTVARLYDIIIKVSSNSDMQASLQISNFANTIYVLAGVFMLFRVAIGMIQMLLNPDKVTDKQAGAGKMITRIITCIILLWAFYPNGVLIKPYDKTTGEGGLLPRMEQAVLGTNDTEGLFDTILKNRDRIGGNPYDFSKDTKSKSKSCYYLGVSGSGDSADLKFYKIKFKTGKQDSSNYKEVEKSNGIYYEVVSGVVGGKDSGSGLEYSSLDLPLKYGGDMVTSKGNLKCPKAFDKKGNYYTSSELGDSDSAIIGGYTSLKEMQKGAKKIANGNKDYLSTFLKLKDIGTGIWSHVFGGTFLTAPLVQKFLDWRIDSIVGEFVDYPLLTDLENREAALSFAQAAASSFQECTGDDTKECHAVQDKMFGSTGANHDAVELIGNDQLNVDFFFSWIFGLAIIVYLIFLIVDIIIRKFKLVILEFLSPIPIICYADPNDKIFNQWLKMYMATYVDIFVKLFAINVGLILLNADLIPDGTNILLKILYIVAIFLFIKAIPSMISKIFGLDNFGGSFKDIGKTFKKGLGLGAGAAIGATVGGLTGGVMGGFRGALRGAGAGVKGDYTGNAAGIAAYNRNLQYAKESGSSAGGRLLARLGINDYEDQKHKIDVAKAQLAENKAKELEAKQMENKKNSNLLSNISGWEKKIESNFEKGKYDNRPIAAVNAYRNAVAELEELTSRPVDTSIVTSDPKLDPEQKQAAIEKLHQDRANEIKERKSEISTLKGKALDAAKEAERVNGWDDTAKAYLQAIKQDISKKEYEEYKDILNYAFDDPEKRGIDGAKKKLDARNIQLSTEVAGIEAKYTAAEQDLASQERALENSPTKANYDAMNKLNK